MNIQYCDNCKKYTLKETCACKTKTRKASYKYKQPRRTDLIIETVKKNADKKRN